MIKAKSSSRKKLKKAKRWLVYALVRSLVFLLALFPLRFVVLLGAFFGRIAYLVDGSDRRRAIAQLRDSLQLSQEEAQRVARRVFANVGRVAVELAVLPSIDLERYVELPESERVKIAEAMSGGKGALFITGHVGSWELLAQRVARAGFDAVTFAKKASNPYLGEWLVARRAEGKLETINRGDAKAPRQMIAALKRGALLGALIDQDTKVESVHVPFFGKPASTPVVPAKLALRSKLPVLTGFIERKPDGSGHRVRIERVELPGEATAATALLTQKIEDAIRARPDEWVWFHARWKR
jgi:KDO2-lipid IV(A) lauroyltransferase